MAYCGMRRRKTRSAPMSTSTIDAYDECNTNIDVKGAIRKSARRARALSGSSVSSPTSSPRAGSRASVPRGRHSGRDRRVPCERLHLDAAGAPPGPEGGARSRRDAVCRRRRRPHRRFSAGHRGRPSKPIYNYLADMPDMAAATLPSCRATSCTRVAGQLHELRRRARLPVPVQLLHHHQRAGPQVALPHRRRCRGDRARQCQAGHHQLLRHRRQFRPQQELGADPRPADRSAREAKASRSGSCFRSTRCATAFPASSRRRRGRAATRCSSGWRTSTRNRCSAPRSVRTRSGNIARCCRPGASRGHDLRRLYPRLPDRHAGDRSRATSRSSRRNCRSTSWSSSCLTPLPGSEDHKKLFTKGVPMDPDMNNYDLEHVCTGHPRCRRPNGKTSIATPGRATTPTNTSRPDAARARQRDQSQQDHRTRMIVFSGATASKACIRSSSAGPPQVAHAAPSRPADREPVDLLSRAASPSLPAISMNGARWCGAISRSRSA